MKNSKAIAHDPSSFPPPQSIKRSREKIREYNASHDSWLIVLDDDPTGCQTVHDVTIITSWEIELLEKIMSLHRFFFILTNTRAYSATEASRINKEIIERLINIAGKSRLKIISRSDSTLRGHFSAETRMLIEAAGPFDGLIITPYFKEGLRYTLDDSHYVLQDEKLVEAHLTEFAKDPVFGYKNSYLPAWIEEKSKGFWKKEQVVSISLHTIRNGGVEQVYKQLQALTGATPVVVNALCDEDIEVVVLALCRAEQEGKKFLYRSAASFVKIRAGLADAPLFQLQHQLEKGLVIVGSHVNKTTEQLQPLLSEPSLQKFEIILHKVFSIERDAYLKKVLGLIEIALQAGQSVLIYTERGYALNDHTDKLGSGMLISNFLSALVFNLKVPPDFIIAKGGITSHDIAVKGLLLKEALVLGQIEQGVPIWKSTANSKFTDLYYVVFPGNVGGADTLNKVYLKFKNKNLC